MKYKRSLIYLLLLSLVFTYGCEIINPAEDIPASIHINVPQVEMEPGQGSARHKITEVWTIAGPDLLGAFGTPTDVHFIPKGTTTRMEFRPGIRNNGILDAAIVYPMMTEYVIELETTPGSLSVVTPVFRYKPEAVFSLVTDFETVNDFIDNRDTIPASNLVRTDVEPFEGNFSGEIILTSDANFIEVANAISLADLPIDGTETYLEFHYKSEVNLDIGLLGSTLTGQNFSNFFYTLLPSDDWNKIYIELTDVLENSGFPSYKILFRSRYPSNGTATSYKILLDNIKVVHL